MIPGKFWGSGMTTDKKTLLAGDVRPREVAAWAMYDFANSANTTVVITCVYNAYFVEWSRARRRSTFAWTAALAVSYALVILTAPAIGAYADLRAAKKACCSSHGLNVVFTAALHSPGRGPRARDLPHHLSNFAFGRART